MISIGKNQFCFGRNRVMNFSLCLLELISKEMHHHTYNFLSYCLLVVFGKQRPIKISLVSEIECSLFKCLYIILALVSSPSTFSGSQHSSSKAIKWSKSTEICDNSSTSILKRLQSFRLSFNKEVPYLTTIFEVWVYQMHYTQSEELVCQPILVNY